MSIRYRRDEEIIVDAFKTTRRGLRDVQRPTGTEKARTASTVEVLESSVVPGGSGVVSLGDGRLTVADVEPVSADGAGKPVDAVWLVRDPAGGVVTQWGWDGSAWLKRALSVEVIPLIAAGMLEADAIDGMVITGATIRTAPAGQRVQLDAAGLRTFNASNEETAKLTADEGGLALTGSLVTTEGGNTRRATLSDGGLYLDLPGSPGADNLTVGPGYIRSTDANSRLIIEKQSGSPGTGVSVKAGNSPGSSASLDVDGNVTGGAINLAADAISFGGLLSAGNALRGDATKRNALTPHDGMRFWHTVDSRDQLYTKGAWRSLLRVDGAFSAVSTDGSGYGTVSHSLGTIPASATANPASSTPVLGDRMTIVVHTMTATHITFRFGRLDTGGWLLGNPVHFRWIAVG